MLTLPSDRNSADCNSIKSKAYASIPDKLWAWIVSPHPISGID